MEAEEFPTAVLLKVVAGFFSFRQRWSCSTSASLFRDALHRAERGEQRSTAFCAQIVQATAKIRDG
jgi:hypothetical protein